MGIFRPRIYLWSGLSKEEKGFVIEHEKTHVKRRDYLVKLFFYLVLIVHWFNPLVWLSYFLCMKDMEMSCDESVMKKMGDKARADYSETLLSLATGRKIFAGTPLFFGEGDAKSRIKNILSYKKPTVWVVSAGILVVVVLCISFMGNPSEDFDASEDNPAPTTVSSYNYPQYPVYVRTMGVGSIGCEYGYCAGNDRDDDRILEELRQMNGFYFSNYYNEDVALYYTDEPQEIKLYHAWEGSTDYEEYAFAGEGYKYPYGVENKKYVIQVPDDYGMHYFFAVITWEDGSEDLMYFSMEYKYNPPSTTDYNKMQLMKNHIGEMEVKYPELHFPSQTMEAFTVRLTLPQGWFLVKRGLTSTDIATLGSKEITGTFLTTYFFNEDGICVGKMGCNYYEVYEGEEVNPQAIYNQVALGNHYQFDVRNSYEIINQSNVIETAAVDVLYIEPANNGGNITTNYGILSRSREGRVYVALELESELVSKEDVTAIAESISFEVAEYSRSQPEEKNKIPEESTDLQMVWHADLTGDGEEEIIVVDSTGWYVGMFVELYVWSRDGTLLWNEEGAYAHAGWNTIFLVNISGRDYLLQYIPYLGNDIGTYVYEIFDLKNDPVNSKEVYASDTVRFRDFLHDTDKVEEVFDIDKMVEFADDINGYMSKGLLLFSTEDGELKVGSNVGKGEAAFRNKDGSLIVNHDFVESYSFCDWELVERGIVDKTDIDKMELREKLQVYLEKCLLNRGD